MSQTTIINCSRKKMAHGVIYSLFSWIFPIMGILKSVKCEISLYRYKILILKHSMSSLHFSWCILTIYCSQHASPSTSSSEHQQIDWGSQTQRDLDILIDCGNKNIPDINNQALHFKDAFRFSVNNSKYHI